ncbi:hypothetical protein B0T18DRAFT_310461, partial [Schizothecium vesticola]
PTLDSEPFSRPRPRPPRSSSQQAQIRVQNRRREYLARNPSYFVSSEHELAATDPLLYDTLIRRYQTPAEREAEGRARGYARVLEGSLLRGEERLARLAGESRVDEALPPPETKTEGHAQWTHFLRERFIRGEDEDFEYAAVDGDEELDVIERVEREEAWFDGESPAWDLGEEEEEEEEGGGDAARRKERELQGETGVQDF